MDCWSDLSQAVLDSPDLEEQPGGERFGSEPDEATLKQIAKMTGGKFYSATSAGELQMVFQNLHHYLAVTNRTIEVSVVFAAFGAIMAIVGWVLSVFWHPLL